MNQHKSQQTEGMEDLTFSGEPCKPLAPAKGEAPFKDSWEAEAYALGNLLIKLNHVTAKEWMDLMAESIQEAQSFGDPDTGETYYHHWCRSLEKFCFQTGLIQPTQHREILELWKRAISNTPHGVPLVIENADLAPAHQDEPHEADVHSHTTTAEPEFNAQSHDKEYSHERQVHSHERPLHPPATYYAPISTQILKSPSVKIKSSSVENG
jgi:nitrile hydratase accessory protein